jgi:Protein of unknown function (DUF3574)
MPTPPGIRRLTLLLALLSLAACAHLQPQAWVQDTLYFGLSSPRGPVTEGEWAGFLAQEVTPRFPHGLTTWKAAGQWSENGQPIVHEDSRVLEILHPPDEEDDSKIEAIRTAYKRRFLQQSVLRVSQRVDANF